MNFKFIYLAIFIMLISETYSQDIADRGSKSLSGTALISYSSYEESGKAYKISFQPRISCFIFSNLELGMNFQLTYSYDNKLYIRRSHGMYGYDSYYKEAKTIESRLLGAGPLAAYYFGKGKYKPFISVSCFYNYISFTKENFVNQDNYYSTFSACIELGCLIPIGEKFALTPLIQYQKMNYDKTIYEIQPFYQTLSNEETISFGAQLKMFL